MFLDGRNLGPDSTIEADLCIVGAGPAGISLALQFIDTKTTVALIESGGAKWDEKAQKFADFHVEGFPYYPPSETHIRAFGGSTSAWGGICTRLDPIDFEHRPWVPDSGWPISYEEVDAYYEPALRLCGLSGTGARSPITSSNSGGVRWTGLHFSASAQFGRMYKVAIRRASNVKTLMHSTVAEIELHPSARHVEAVRVVCRGGNQYRVKARHFVLACGGIDNPLLLLASNRIITTGIGNDNDVVGRYFMEHPRVTERYRLPAEIGALAEFVPSRLARLSFSRLQFNEDVQRTEKLLNYQANLYFGYVGHESDQWEAIRRIVFSIRYSSRPFFPSMQGGRNRLRWADVMTLLSRIDLSLIGVAGTVLRLKKLRSWIEVTSGVEQPPLSHNRVELSGSRNELGIPVPKLVWSISEQEERTYRRGLELVVGELEKFAPGLAQLRMGEPDPWPSEITGTWHHMGTTRMHEDPKKGVVDGNCRVHGVKNLFAAGSSVFTTGGAHGPTLTLVALALRLADHIKSLPDIR